MGKLKSAIKIACIYAESLMILKYPDIESDLSLPDWQMELIDSHLKSIKENPETLKAYNNAIKRA